MPFFSPDGQQLGFWALDEIRVVPIGGGTPVSLAPAERAFGASWADDGYIYFGQGEGGIWRVPETSGVPQQVVEVDEGEQAHGPQLLPGGEWLLFTLADGEDWNEARIVVQSLVTKERRELDLVGTDARYVPTGHIVYSRRGSLFAVVFDVDGTRVRGGPAFINIDGVQQSGRDENGLFVSGTGATQYAFSSQSGGLVYMPDSVQQFVEGRLVWRNREGRVDRLPFPPDRLSNPRLSPDQTRIAVAVQGDDEDFDISIYDIVQGDDFQLTREGSNMYPVWSDDSDWVYFDSDRDGNRDVWRKRSDNTGEVEPVWAEEGRDTPWSISPDGMSLLFADMYNDDKEISILSLADPKEREIVVVLDGDAWSPRYSPDGLYFAYWEIYSQTVLVQEVSSGDNERLGPGTNPVWSRDGSELFYVRLFPLHAEMRSIAVDAAADDPFSPSIFLFDLAGFGLFNAFDVAKDGRFLMLEQTEQTSAELHLVFVDNWFEELKRLVPTGGSR